MLEVEGLERRREDARPELMGSGGLVLA